MGNQLFFLWIVRSKVCFAQGITRNEIREDRDDREFREYREALSTKD